MNDERKRTDAPAAYRTPQRPGQTGEQNATRPGPSPLSPNPSGPHPAYDAHDVQGLAAGKHRPESKDAPQRTLPADRSDFVVMANGKRVGVIEPDGSLPEVKRSGSD